MVEKLFTVKLKQTGPNLSKPKDYLKCLWVSQIVRTNEFLQYFHINDKNDKTESTKTHQKAKKKPS